MSETLPTIEDLQRYFSEKGINQDCELCRHDNWDARLPDGKRWPALAAYKAGNEPGFFTGEASTVIPVYMLTCTHCGNTKIMLLQILLDWIKAQEG